VDLTWKHYDKNEYRYLALFWLTLYAIYAWVNTLSVLSDYARLEIDIAAWKPFVWEFSSHIIGLALLPFLFSFDRMIIAKSNHVRQIILGHLLFSIVYSISHVVGMVIIRKLSYSIMGGHYDFGDWPKEMLYEYRKDAVGYIQLLFIIYAYRFIISRLRGEATVIAVGEHNQPSEKTERLLVKKIGKEFIIRVKDIDWIDAAGNYMNLNLAGNVYPLRETMSGLEKKLDPNQFVRIHRSTMVNIERISEINSLDTGDFELKLKCGQKLKLSRRYREQVKSLLSLG
jgi:hypothetical protein